MSPSKKNQRSKNNLPFWINKHSASALLDISVHTLKSYRILYWQSGIHYQYLNSRTIRYNRELIIDWMANISYPEAHQRAIQAYLASLPSNQTKKRDRKYR